MKITGLLANLCPNGDDCPKIHDTDGSHVIVQGDLITDPTTVGKKALPAGEGLVSVPRELIYPAGMSLPEMSAWILERHTFHLLRIENRRAYAAASDGGDFARYLDGADGPIEGGAWGDKLRGWTAEGRIRTKIHVVEGELSDYERYEFEWGFTRTVRAGEVVRVLEADPGVLTDVPDFWVVDTEHVVRMDYDDAGKFVAAHVVTGPDAATYRALARVMWAESTPFETWWDAHPGYRRTSRAA